MSQNDSLTNLRSSPVPDTMKSNLSDPSTAIALDPLFASTSLDDSGQSKRPRDARLLHIILTSLGVQAYQERVPLQLMDFAYRYSSSVLQDALHLTSEVYNSSGNSSRNASGNDLGNVTLQALRLAIASRSHYQFQCSLPKEHFQELAVEKNKVALPVVGKATQIRLPPERYCLTGVGYNLREEWDDEIDGIISQPIASLPSHNLLGSNGTVIDSQMQGVERSERNASADDTEMRDT